MKRLKNRRNCNLKSLIFSADDIEKTVTQLHLTSDGFRSAHYIFNTLITNGHVPEDVVG